MATVRRRYGLRMLYAKHWDELCHYIKKRFGSGPPEAEDVVQVAFVKFAEMDAGETIGNPRAYLFRTAHNVWIDEHRRLVCRGPKAGESEVECESDDRTPDRVIIARERLDVLARCMRSMPATRRRSFLLNRLHGLSCPTIARITGYSESAIKKHIDLALRDLEASISRAEWIEIE